MTVILCLDDRCGMAFNNRRQSRDKAVINDILTHLNGERLIISPFSEDLFLNESNLLVKRNPLESASGGDFVFVENLGLSGYTEKIQSIIIYRWNRLYPSDISLDIKPEELGLQLIESCEFVGHSHKKITKEIYKK